MPYGFTFFFIHKKNHRVLYVDVEVQKKYQLQKSPRIFTKTILQISKNEKTEKTYKPIGAKLPATHFSLNHSFLTYPIHSCRVTPFLLKNRDI